MEQQGVLSASPVRRTFTATPRPNEEVTPLMTSRAVAPVEGPEPRALRQRPAVHELTFGAYLQEPVPLGDRIVAVPCVPMGYGAQAAFAAEYLWMIGGTVDRSSFEALRQQGAEALPVVALVARASDLSPAAEHAEDSVRELLDRARLILAWATGEYPVPFAVVTTLQEGTHFRLVLPQSRRRTRLGFGNTGADFLRMLDKIWNKAESDERFAFALAQFHDAVRDQNPRFRTARLFTCLEGLAHKFKRGGVGSRKAIRAMLELHHVAPTMQASFEGCTTIQADVIELAGRLRDALFHGTRFERNRLPQALRQSFDLIEQAPGILADSLQTYCEIELARRANDPFSGQQADEH